MPRRTAGLRSVVRGDLLLAQTKNTGAKNTADRGAADVADVMWCHVKS